MESQENKATESHDSFSIPRWKHDLRSAIRTPEELFSLGYIEASSVEPIKKVLNQYQFLLPRYYANLIDKTDPFCPIRLQAIPNPLEFKEEKVLNADPLLDFNFQPAPRITHRYGNRLLLHLTANCSMYCRYCFRKTLLNSDREDFFVGQMLEGIQYIETNEKIDEVIFSGGDPLLVDNSIWAGLLERLNLIPHLKRIRVHTRTVVTLPSRIDSDLIRLLQKATKPIIWVNHFNHPKELTPEAKLACMRLKTAPVTLLNQSVLLPSVNTDAKTLKQLCEGLFDFGMLPYYLHHPDPAQGTSHFQLSKEAGLTIYHELQSLLPGYLVPRYVQDDPSLPYKKNVELL